MPGSTDLTVPKIVMVCGHCGNRTSFEIKAECSQRHMLDHRGTHDVIIWRVLICSTCSKPTLEEDTQIVDSNIIPSRSKRTEILYPLVRTRLSNLPEAIERTYLEALRVRNVSPASCAVMVGRTLEAACNHEKAQGKDLANKLNYLASTNRIPQTLAEMAHQVRQFRNSGAHVAEDEVTEEDVPIIMDFAEAILEYLYVAPAKIEAVRARLKKTP